MVTEITVQMYLTLLFSIGQTWFYALHMVYFCVLCTAFWMAVVSNTEWVKEMLIQIYECFTDDTSGSYTSNTDQVQNERKQQIHTSSCLWGHSVSTQVEVPDSVLFSIFTEARTTPVVIKQKY